MPRPKSTASKKRNMTLTVSAQTRAELEFISQAAGESISAMIAEWASKEARRIARATKQDIPDVNQLKLID